MMDDTTLEHGLHAAPPADPAYRSHLPSAPPTGLDVVPTRASLRLPLATGATFASMTTIAVAVAAAVVVGLLLIADPAQRNPGGTGTAHPPATGPADNGLIAYSHDGDIYVGDPKTGDTDVIVTGPADDSHPVFSPDGARIAFLRGDAWTDDASIIVVRPDGSDERVAMPIGYAQGIGFAWTPDGGSLVVNHDSEPRQGTSYYAGDLSLVDASGASEPQLITPPLPRAPGGPYFTAQVAPMFRPPDGDTILSADGPALAPGPGQGEHLYVWDASLERRGEVPLDALGAGEPFEISAWELSWSPDGSRIAFRVGAHADGLADPTFAGAYVMDADGSDLSPIPEMGAWSPDGTRMAVGRGCPDPGRPGGAAIVIIDLASGAQQLLEASIVETKTEGSPPPWPVEWTDECRNGWYAGSDGRVYDHEGWSWSPDGSSILMLDRPGAHPLVIDVETGKATELPWASDSAPSWQRVALD